jgi:hypothetical protein
MAEFVIIMEFATIAVGHILVSAGMLNACPQGYRSGYYPSRLH